MNRLLAWSIVALMIVVGLIWFLLPTEPAEGKLDEFAQCLASKEVTMYGAYWCSHCQNEKKAFGSSFQYVPYVECTEQTALCTQKNVRGFPTWIFPDSRRFEGEMGITRLSEESLCPLP